MSRNKGTDFSTGEFVHNIIEFVDLVFTQAFVELKDEGQELLTVLLY